jgi:hypothetical protein
MHTSLAGRALLAASAASAALLVLLAKEQTGHT